MKIKKLVQTPFISYDDENMLSISVADWDFCNPYGVELKIDGETVYSGSVFAPEFTALIPSVSEKKTLTAVITPFEDVPVIKSFALVSPKKWRIPMLYSSHEDLGYCAYVDKLHSECCDYLKKAMELCEKNPGFKYMIEHAWWLSGFDKYATDEEKEHLKKLFAEKRIELNSIQSGIHTHWQTSEQLVRSEYYTVIDAARKYNVQPECAVFTDLSGISPSAIDAYGSMGIKYFAVLSNSFRNSPYNLDFPPIFYWERNGRKALFWYQRSYRPDGLNEIWCNTKRQYPEGEFFFDTTKRLKTEKWITERLSGLPYSSLDIFPISFYDDRELPTSMLISVCEEMKKHWKYPEFSMEIPSRFMAEIDEKYSQDLPVFSGDIPDQWADFITIAPEWAKEKRNTARAAHSSELLSAVKAVEKKLPYPKKAFDDAYWKLSIFDEHCWATSSKHPQKMHRYNLDKTKRADVKKTHDELNEILFSGNGKAQILFPSLQGSHLPLRSADGTVPKNGASQALPDGTAVSAPFNLNGIQISDTEFKKADSSARPFECNTFETDYYRVSLIKEAMQISSIIDKESGCELIDQASDFAFGQFVYTYSEGKTDPKLSYEVAKPSSLAVEEGDICFAVTQKSFEEQSGAEISMQLLFYKHEKSIDIDLSFEHATGLMGDFHDRYKKNYFFAFPFNVDDPSFYSSSQVGEINEAHDRINGLNACDFTIVQGYAVAENDSFGVGIYSADMPVFHIGEIKLNRFCSSFSAKRAHFFLYAASNRCNNLVYLTENDCRARYSLSVLPFSGSHLKAIPSWAEEKDHPPVFLPHGTDLPEKELASVGTKSLALTALKRAENEDNAVIVRLKELSGQSESTYIDVFFPVKSAYLATCDEKNLTPLKTEKNRVYFNTSPHSYITLKLYGDFKI